ncbi:hypothetical protein K505DRAFT_330418 [Melanomma pulvis-pyrius CBS 109.77]|uniref:Uncharacterized protein n=1 Tax=Melanomma pulvis-pyrius CBS 109.77 TaxID=1314802 RepID=A0A6A6WR05_9PLEO|nr:hypothetical protein K505DRAFT_330418 [Melanomma pulvis-pyrius CBS 109.77]
MLTLYACVVWPPFAVASSARRAASAAQTAASAPRSAVKPPRADSDEAIPVVHRTSKIEHKLSLIRRPDNDALNSDLHFHVYMYMGQKGY